MNAFDSQGAPCNYRNFIGVTSTIIQFTVGGVTIIGKRRENETKKCLPNPLPHPLQPRSKRSSLA